MTDDSPRDVDGVDFVLVAYREDGLWQVQELSEEKVSSLDTFTTELRRWPGEAGSLGLVSVDEDFFVMVRVLGPEVRVLLSDITAATDWPIARSVVDHLELPLPGPDDDPDEEEQVPAGDPGLVSDLGMGAMDMGALLDDFELYPDEMLGDIAARLGFGRQYDDAVGVPTL